MRRFFRASLLVVAFLATIVVCAWLGRHILLRGAGRLLVSEDAVASADAIFVADADAIADTLEAARLYHEGISHEIVLGTGVSNPEDEKLRRLGLIRLPPAEYAAWLLELSGVPKADVHILPEVVNGTETEVAAAAAFARRQHPHSVLFIIARSHTARARWLLRRQLPAGVRLLMHSPETDTFDADSWWHTRDGSRELVMEYIRWVNTFVLRDPWRRYAQ